MKAQMFVVTMIFLVGLIFFVQQALFGYTSLDLTEPFGADDFYINENIRDTVDEIIKGCATCEEANDKLSEFLYLVQKETIKRGYELELDYLLDCSQPFPPGPSEPECGDGVIEGSEVCECGIDGICGNSDDDTAGETCISQGYASGDLACSLDCLGFDTSGCVPIGVCGDGTCDPGECSGGCIADCTLADCCGIEGLNPLIGEVCDDNNNIDCDGCKGDCSRLDNICGDMITECAEGCDDGDQDNSDSCPDGPFGTCQNAVCGDGHIWNTDGGTEVCDGTNVGNETCESQLGSGYTGNLACSGDCSDYDTSGCVGPAAISSCEELQGISGGSGSYYLTGPIDCSATNPAVGGSIWGASGFNPIGSFTGEFDGRGYEITGLFINRPGTSSVGLFGGIGLGVEIKDVGLVDVNITGFSSVGGLVGRVSGGNITRAYSTGSVRGNGNYVGGLVGYFSNSPATNNLTGLYSTADVNGSQRVGGLIGYVASGNGLHNSYSAGNVSGTAPYVGGLTGYFGSGGSCKNSFWDTETSGQSTSPCGTGKTTAEMKQQSTFDPPWDFTSVWKISEGVSYPCFQWQVNCPV